MLGNELFLFHPEGHAYRLVMQHNIGYLRGIELQDERAHGLLRLRLQEHGSCCEHYVTFLDYDGVRYREVAKGNERFTDDRHVVFRLTTQTTADGSVKDP